MRSCSLPSTLAALCIVSATAFVPPAFLRQRASKSDMHPLQLLHAATASNSHDRSGLSASNESTSCNSLHNDDSDDEEAEGHSLEVSYEGRTVNIMVRPNESILAALERTGAANALCVSSFPQDCRRGNCLTCTGRIREGSTLSSLEYGEDGLAPHVSDDIKEQRYVLTCSSYVVGDGLRLELGRNADAWEETYRARFESADAERVGLEAQAKLLRLVAESDVPKWKRETEETLEKSG